MPRYIDAHCHMPMRPVPDGCGAVINAVGEDDWGVIIDAANKSESIYGAIGVHPWRIAAARDGWDARLTAALRDNPQIMVGEIGMDINYPDIDAQREIFVRQLKIATDFGRVAHIHWVGAWDILPVLLSGCNAPVVMHSFAGSAELMRAIARKCDAYFSFGPAISNDTRRRMRGVVRAAAADKILVESDNDNSADIPTVVAGIAALRGVAPHDMADIIYDNSHRMLKHGQAKQD